MKIIAMIPARLGSQRLKRKNLVSLKGIPLIEHAIIKSINTKLFDEIWVNTESDEIGQIALKNNIHFHKRPKELANNDATSEDFVYEFLKHHDCDFVVQVHSIAPLLTTLELTSFVNKLTANEFDVLLSSESIQIECAFNYVPINFTFHEKTNSQELDPIQRITWSVTGWRRKTYMKAYEMNNCATYSGKIGYFRLGKFASHIIKNKHDLEIAESLFDLIHDE